MKDKMFKQFVLSTSYLIQNILQYRFFNVPDKVTAQNIDAKHSEILVE